MRAACEKLRSEEGNVLAGPAQKAVDQLERMSGYLREKQLADLLDDLESYAQTQARGRIWRTFCRGFGGGKIF